MDVGCNCFGVATAAKVPVKRYNLLVPAIFPVTEPSLSKPLGIGTEKNIKRLSEYLERNEYRIPKSSRRLARRLHADLASNKLGFVRVAIAAYNQLTTCDDGKFARLYAKELIIRYPTKKSHIWSIGSRIAASKLPPESAHLGSVVGALISSPQPLAQKWGLELLIALLKQQKTAEFIGNFETFVPLLCSIATTPQSSSSANGKITKIEKTVEPAGESNMGENEQITEYVPALCLQALLEHLRYCFRVSYVSLYLDTITYAVLSIVEREGSASGVTYATAADVLAHGVNPLALAKQSIGTRVGSSSPGLAALLVYEELGRMTRDAAEGKKVLEFLFRFLDQKPQRWLGGPALDAGLGVMRDACSLEHQRYLIASSLLSHVAAGKGLGPGERLCVLKEAMRDAMALEQSTAPSALLLALQELSKVFISSDTNASEDQKHLESEVLAAVKSLSGRVGTRLQLTSVLGAELSRFGGPSSPTATASLQCCAAAATSYPTLASRPAGTLASHLPNVLLRSLLAILLSWTPEQRLLAHQILYHPLRGVPQGSYPTQVELILSALWYEAVLPGNTPQSYVAMDRTFGATIVADGGSEEELKACQLAVALQKKVLADQKESTTLSAAQKGSVIALSSSMLMRIDAKMRQPALLDLAVLKDSSSFSLSSLKLVPLNGENVGTVNGGGLVNSGTAFTAEDEAVAAKIMSIVSKLDGDKAVGILSSISAFKHLPSAMINGGFSPKPITAIAPQVNLAAPVSPTPEGGSQPPQQQSLQARRLQAAFASSASHFDGGSSVTGTYLSDAALAGSRFAVDLSVVDGSESVETRSIQGVGAMQSTSVGEEVKSGGPTSSQTVSDVIAGVEAALTSVVG